MVDVFLEAFNGLVRACAEAWEFFIQIKELF